MVEGFSPGGFVMRAMNDTRRSPRAPIRHRIWCEGDDVTLYVRTLNASQEGLFIRTPTPVEVGRRFRISFEDPVDSIEVIAEVEVVWSRAGAPGEPGMGVRIVRFAKGRDEYGRFVERLLAQSSSAGHLPAIDVPLAAAPKPLDAPFHVHPDRMTGS